MTIGRLPLTPQDVRRAYREVLLSAPFGDFISGVILYKETLYQAAANGTPFTSMLRDKGIYAGIKVDEVRQCGVGC